MLKIREKIEVVKIKDLFQRLEIKEIENETKPIQFQLEVKTPYGFKKIKTAFRTEKQTSVTTYFKNNKTLKTSENHRVRSGGNWVYVKDLKNGDLVETENGVTQVKRQHKGKQEILYDISVEEVHCYYSNGIVSHNSWSLVSMAAEAMRQGKNVVYYTLELQEAYVGRRFDANFTKINFQDVTSHKDRIYNTTKNITGKLKIKYYPLKTVSANSLKAHIDRLSLLEWKPDLVIVDYADILRPINSDKNSNSYKEIGNIYEELRTVAGELQLPVWSASQANRCLDLNTTYVVKENKGNILIKFLKEGDKILTHDGFKKVSHIYPIQKQPVYEIRLKSGKSIRVSEKHEFPTLYKKLKSIENGLSVGDKLYIKK